jgi:hypothetical protein
MDARHALNATDGIALGQGADYRRLLFVGKIVAHNFCVAFLCHENEIRSTSFLCHRKKSHENAKNRTPKTAER